jgi:hypothetical protein
MARIPSRPSHASAADNSGAVDAFLATLEHPHLSAIRTLRQLVLSSDPSIAEGIKWNAPSFRTTEYFATMHLRQKQGVAVILHLGAKKRDPGIDAETIADPDRLLKWLGPDRALVAFADAQDVEARAAPFQALLRRWIAYV